MSDSTVRADLCDRGECERLRARVEELEAQLATARDDTGWAEELETLANDLPADCYPEEAGVLLGAADRLRMVAAENARLREALRFCRDVSAEERDDYRSVAWLCTVYAGALRGIHATAAAALGEVRDD